MRCDHTSYEMRDAGLFCRTCGMSSTEVYYEARNPQPDTTAADIIRLAQQMNSAQNAFYGYRAIRPESAVMLGNSLGPTATEIRAADERRRLQHEAYLNAFPQPRIAVPAPERKPILTRTGVYVIIGAVAGSCVGSGFFLHSIPAFSAGVAGFLYIAALALMDMRSGFLGIAETAREQMRDLRSPPRSEARTGAIVTYGFGGRDLRVWTQ
jgi:hypothetical protein